MNSLPPRPSSGKLDFSTWLDEMGLEIARNPSVRHQWLAREILKAAKLARYFEAATPEEFDARRELNEEWLAKGGRR